MPYLNCPNCRLTLYSAAAHSTIDSCPRCDAALGGAPRRMLDSSALDGRAKHTDGAVTRALTEAKKPRQAGDSSRARASHFDGNDRHRLIREVLKGTGRFRDRRGPQDAPGV